MFIYKSLMLLQKYVDAKELSHHSFMAGLIGGYFVFGEYQAVNYQVRGNGNVVVIRCPRPRLSSTSSRASS